MYTVGEDILALTSRDVWNDSKDLHQILYEDENLAGRIDRGTERLEPNMTLPAPIKSTLNLLELLMIVLAFLSEGKYVCMF